MTESTTPCLSQTTKGKYQPTPEQLRQAIELAVLLCIEYKAKAIEAAEQTNRHREKYP